MKKIRIIISFIVLLGSCQCDDIFPEPNTGLPPISDTGENFIAFMLNEEVFYVNGTNFISDYRMDGRPYYLMIFSKEDFNRRHVKQYFTMQFYNDISQGDSILLINNQDIEIEFNNAYPLPDVIYYNENIVDGYVKFSKVDHESTIISGTFEMTLEKDGYENLEITEGRFDFKY
ncbi:hypothetical protein [Marinigracilibium pacificum]|uniref:Uncharacterized protein n=1 Tax=Marinigracilibium pacificum TaxID=2729599 RepID=A0A848JBE3_9BACT|nr:hypothetical protein [Marinigracilibium pacificum]NMM50342.1 hypothetical protein [Marinigracilibium pacificum]